MRLVVSIVAAFKQVQDDNELKSKGNLLAVGNAIEKNMGVLAKKVCTCRAPHTPHYIDNSYHHANAKLGNGGHAKDG
jgi:hypothetical protein